MLLRTVRNNIVQSIRAFTVNQLQDTAKELGQHFLYANLAMAQSKQDVVPGIGGGFVVLGKSTSSMTKSEMSELQELIAAFGAERNVRFKAYGDES